MGLTSVTLSDFRNYESKTFEFSNGVTVIAGENAKGKTNLLEAIYLLSTTKSLRAATEDELIEKRKEFARIEGFLVDDPPASGETELLVIIGREIKEVSFKKKVMVNGIGRRVTDFIGNLPAVIFYPSDINMVTGPPSLRRWHLDLSLAQADQHYKKALTAYEQFLTARNRILKRIREGQGRVNELDYWTKGLVEQGQIVANKRKAFFEFINFSQHPLGEFKFKYTQSEISIERLIQTNGREVAAAATLIGPHRDDFRVILSETKDINKLDSSPSAQNDKNGRDLAHYGSRGEQRTATLAFKLAQLEYMAASLGKRPILLLDDVFSELDANHRAHVVEIVGKQQTVIATVELENIPKDFLDSARIIRIEDGEIAETST